MARARFAYCRGCEGVFPVPHDCAKEQDARKAIRAKLSGEWEGVDEDVAWIAYCCDISPAEAEVFWGHWSAWNLASFLIVSKGYIQNSQWLYDLKSAFDAGVVHGKAEQVARDLKPALDEIFGA